MIDYDKLKVAHELTHKLPFNSYSFDCWCCNGIESGFFYVLTFEDHENLIHEYESENIDELIAKLQELTHMNIDEFTKLELKILNYTSQKVIEKHKTCLQNQFDNGYFWAMKELQEFLLKREFKNE